MIIYKSLVIKFIPQFPWMHCCMQHYPVTISSERHAVFTNKKYINLDLQNFIMEQQVSSDSKCRSWSRYTLGIINKKLCLEPNVSTKVYTKVSIV